jgi:hypothetical protein
MTYTGNALFPGNLRNELACNALRDTAWTAVSAVNINASGHVAPLLESNASLHTRLTSNAFTGPLVGQWVFGTAPMLLLASHQTIKERKNLSPKTLANIWAPVTAASCAILMWDLGQAIGYHVGRQSSSALWYGSSITAGLVAAPFAGMFEGFTQWSVKYLFDYATNPLSREMWRQDPSLMRKFLMKEFFLNITIGAIPGAVWQIVFFFALPALMVALGPVGGIILTALLVALAVFVFNFICSHLINAASDAIDQRMGWDKEREKVTSIAQQALAAATPSSEPKTLCA